MSDEKVKVNNDDYPIEDFTLESILAEYKGSAFINGDKKTPPEILNEQTDRIIAEALGKEDDDYLSFPDDFDMSDDEYYDYIDDDVREDDAPLISATVSVEETEDRIDTQIVQDELSKEIINAFLPPEEEPVQEAQTRVMYLNSAESRNSTIDAERDSVFQFFENYRSPESRDDDELIGEVEKAIEKEISYDSVSTSSSQLSYGIVDRVSTFDDELIGDTSEFDLYEEPELKEALRRFTDVYTSISYRVIPASIIALLMAITTLAYEAGMQIPFGIGRNHAATTGGLMIMLLCVMMLCIDIIVRGAGDLMRGAPNAETLILFSCTFSFISAAFAILRRDTSILPYCAVSAVSLATAAFGERLSLRAITETLKTAIVSTEPYGVQAEYNTDIDRSVLKKTNNSVEGFYSNLVHPDISETAFRYAAPILLAAALVLSVIKVFIYGGGEYFLHTLSALLAAAAPFSALLAFSVPYATVSKSMRKSGAAIAGWGGVDDIYFSDGACVTDDDLFPPGTLSFNGVKMYEGVSPTTAIRYTASLIIKSGSGLSRIFEEVLKTQKIDMVNVDEFACYEGGIGAKINDDLVATGSAAFMNLLGIRVPDDMNMKNAVFTAINNRLVALFAVEYLPVNSVQSALISMLKLRVKLFFAMRDFNVTPLMLEQKFRVSLEDIEYIQTKDSYNISDANGQNQGRMAALLAREGLGPFAEAITGGRLMRIASLLATIVTIGSAALGVIYLFYMFMNGAYLSASPGNLMQFMLTMLAAALVVCGYVKIKR
ncbi:MAG: hypothetical protein FWG88_05605 [Oscillospiraceae bacterium]|nr:hypothetical protein [Oscillospiraceae bacterium]